MNQMSYLLDTNICAFYLRGKFNVDQHDIKILPINDAIDIAAREKVRLRLAGTPCDDNFDLLIACTAIANDMVCVTDNTKDFFRFQGIRLENWISR
jgi:tRNA(fMet)-specific endonuclease VapC